MAAEVIGGVAVWKWLAGMGASVAAFFALNWVYWVSKRVQSSVTREELADHLTVVVAAIRAESEKNKTENENLYLQLQVESLREKYSSKVNT